MDADFDFQAWREARQIARNARIANIAQCLSAQLTLLETRANGSTEWYYVPDSQRVVAKSAGGEEHDAFIPGSHSAHTLAMHLQAREDGFGFTLEVFCHTCGNVTLPINDDDPMCSDCQENELVRMAEHAAEGL